MKFSPTVPRGVSTTTVDAMITMRKHHLMIEPHAMPKVCTFVSDYIHIAS